MIAVPIEFTGKLISSRTASFSPDPVSSVKGLLKRVDIDSSGEVDVTTEGTSAFWLNSESGKCGLGSVPNGPFDLDPGSPTILWRGYILFPALKPGDPSGAKSNAHYAVFGGFLNTRLKGSSVTVHRVEGDFLVTCGQSPDAFLAAEPSRVAELGCTTR